LELYVPIKRCGLLIGKGGSMFKELQQEFGVRLKVPHHAEPEGSLTVIEGSEAAVDGCLGKMMHALHGEVTLVNCTVLEGQQQQHGPQTPAGAPRVVSPAHRAAGVPQQALAAPAPGYDGGVRQQIELCADFEHPLVGKLRHARHLGDAQSNVYVMHLPRVLDEFGLYLLFAPFGPVISVHVVRDRANPERHGGIGFVKYADPQAAAQATMFMNGAVLGMEQRPLEVGLHKDKKHDGSPGDYHRSPAAAQAAVVPPPTTAPPAEARAAALAAMAGDTAPCQVELAIPISRCGLLIGAGGTVFKELQHNFGVSLKVPQKSDPEGALTVVSGPANAVSACCAEIARHVHGDCALVSSTGASAPGLEAQPQAPMGVAGQPGQYIPGSVPTDDAALSAALSAGMAGGGALHIDLHIPIARCGLLIGKGGSVFKELQQQYGVLLKVPHQTEPEGTLTMIEGPAGAAEACLQEIERKVKGDCVVMDRKAFDMAEAAAGVALS